MKTREFANLIGTCNIKTIYNRVVQECEKLETPINPDDNKDKGFPVTGKCVVPVYPVYICPVESKEGLNIYNPLERVVNTVVNTLPGGITNSAAEKFYTPAKDCMSWESVDKESLPPLCRYAGTIGKFEVWVDYEYPNGNSEVPATWYVLLADLVLRCDTKKLITDEALEYGFEYITGNGFEKEYPHVGIVLRREVGLDYDWKNNKWNSIIDPPLEPSAVHNFSQHHDFIGMNIPGTFRLTGEEIAKFAYSCKDLVSQVAKFYGDNLDALLVPTKFKITHPIKTADFFLRYCANYAATAPNKPFCIPSKASFPIWIFDNSLNVWYSVSYAFCQLDPEDVPVESMRKKLGTISDAYEVWYDPKADDMYESSQLAYLATLMCRSNFMPRTKDTIAMYGCMEHLNSSISTFILGKKSVGLYPIEGTRIDSMEPLPGYETRFSYIVSTNRRFCKSYGCFNCDSVMEYCNIAADTINPISVEIDGCTERETTAKELGVSLINLLQADIFAKWDNQLSDANKDEDGSDAGILELVEPGAACISYYKEVPHIANKLYENNAGPLIIQYVTGSKRAFTLLPDGDFGELPENYTVPDEAILLNETAIADAKWYYMPDTTIHLTQDIANSIFLNIMHYFVPISNYSSLYAWLFTCDEDWRETGISLEKDSIILSSDQEGVLKYSKSTQSWSYSKSEFKDDDEYQNVGRLKMYVPEEFEMSQREFRTMVNALMSPILGLPKYDGADYNPMFDFPRNTPADAPSADLSITLNRVDRSYGIVNGRWALLLGSAISFGTDTKLTHDEIMDYLYDFIHKVLPFYNSHALYGYFKTMLNDWSTEDRKAYERSIAEITMRAGRTNVFWNSVKGVFEGDHSQFKPTDVLAMSPWLGIHLAVSQCNTIELVQVAECLNYLNNVPSMLANVKVSPSTHRYENAVQALIDRDVNRRLAGVKPRIYPILIIVGTNDKNLGYDGAKWFLVDDISNIGEYSQNKLSVFGNSIYIRHRDFIDFHVPVADVVTGMYHAMNLYFSPTEDQKKAIMSLI